MATLTERQKRFIVQELATYKGPTEVAERVQEEFGVEVYKQQVQYYDPTVGRQKPAEKWRAIFESTREAFKEEVGRHGIAIRSFRLQELEDLYRRAKRMGNFPLAAELLEQAAKELGEKYTNKKALALSGEVDTGGVLVVPDSPDTEDWGEVARRQQGAVRGNGKRNGSGG